MKSDFSVAVHALVYLSVKGCTLSSDALADNICTNAARVRKVMARLKKAGLVGAREGSEGGFCPPRSKNGPDDCLSLQNNCRSCI